MIVTFYHKDGRKERRPIGYGGTLCSTATAPYERREIPGQMNKRLTSEAFQEPAVQTEQVVNTQKAGTK